MTVAQTSLEAYEKLQTVINERQRQVMKVLNNCSCALTNTELALVLGWPINRVTPRVLELRIKGLVVLSCRRPCNVTSSNAMCWITAERAMDSNQSEHRLASALDFLPAEYREDR